VVTGQEMVREKTSSSLQSGTKAIETRGKKTPVVLKLPFSENI